MPSALRDESARRVSLDQLITTVRDTQSKREDTSTGGLAIDVRQC